jgi:hypothetical protein
MPRTVTPAFAAAVAAGTVRPAILVEALFDSGAVRLWSGLGDVVYASNTYTGAGNLLVIDALQERGDVQALGTTITLTGIPSVLVSLALAEPYQGRIVRIYQALLDANLAVIADPDERFTGRADVMAISDDAETATISMTVESRLIDLQRPRERRYTHEDQQTEYPGDLGLNFVAAIQDRPIKWGSGT